MGPNVISFIERAAVIGRLIPANTNDQYAGPLPAVGSLGWLLATDGSKLCFGEVISSGVGVRGDRLTVLDTEDDKPVWHSGFVWDWVADDGPGGAA
jgi:hypothetical protein